MGERKKKIIWMISGILVVGSILVWLLWNWLMPDIFGLGTIHLGQALGLLVLCRILFGNYGLRPGRGWNRRKNRFREKWKEMSPEERKEFIEKRKQRRAEKEKF